MRNLFTRFSQFVIKRPVFVLFIAFICAVALITGVIRVAMATGNETFIKTSTDTYRNNVFLENTFGGENIVVLFKAQSLDDLLTVDNLAKINQVEQSLVSNENVFSVISPVTMLNEITTKQSETMLDAVFEMKDGLAEMSIRLQDVSTSIQEMRRDMPELDLSGTTTNFTQVTSAMDNLILGQQELEMGIRELGAGYEQFGNMALTTGEQLSLFSLSLEQIFQDLSLPQQQANELLMKSAGLKQAGENLTEAGTKMKQISTKSTTMADAPLQTAAGLSTMKDGLLTQVNQLKDIQNQLPDFSQLDDLAEGMNLFSENVLKISEGLETILENSNIMYPGLPRSEKTLATLLYDDDSHLRPIFSQTVLDENHVVMLIRLNGNISDEKKEQVVTLTEDTLAKNPLISAEATVTGKPVLDLALRTEMRNSMQRMVAMALILMVTIVSIVFKVRWRLFPLFVNFLAVVATMGLMGHISLPMTMVSMAAFPILIGLGIDYAIQFHSRYEEEFIREVHNEI